MSQYSTLSLQRPDTRMWRRNQNTVRFQFGASLGPVSHAVLIVIMLSILGLIYLTQITRTGAYGYQINDLKVKQDQLLSQKQDLNVENARLQALERVKQSNVAQAMTTPQQTDYAE